MNTKITPVSLGTPTRTRRGVLGIVMLLGLACCGATGALDIENPPSSAVVMAMADGGTAPSEAKPPAGDTPTSPPPDASKPAPDVKPPGGGTEEPPGERTDVLIDDPASEEDLNA